MAELRGCDFPDHLLYDADTHLWFEPEGDGVYRVGVTPFGVAIAGEILLFTAKPAGVRLAPGRSFGLLEAGKTVFPVKTPLAIELLTANPALEGSARAMNHDAYGCWLARVRADAAEVAAVLQGWPVARAAIERQMVLWRFEDRAGFVAPAFEGRAGV
ncbi:MAG: hypothetical protein J0M28_05255 [Thauera sp.]|nr:hypothetical protein [Thauera sp.]